MNKKRSCSGLSANTVYTQEIKRILPASCRPGYQEQSALKTPCDTDYLENWANKGNFKAQVPRLLRNVNLFG